MASLLTSTNFSRSGASFLRQTIFSWETTLTEDTTQSKLSLCSLPLKSDLRKELLSSEETTSPGKSLRYMGFTTSALESTETPTSGSTLQISSMPFLLPRLLKIKSSAFMEGSHPLSTLLNKSSNSIECKRCLTKGQCATFCGRILTTGAVGVSHREELDILLVKTFLSSLIIQTTSNLLLELISLL